MPKKGGSSKRKKADTDEENEEEPRMGCGGEQNKGSLYGLCEFLNLDVPCSPSVFGRQNEIQDKLEIALAWGLFLHALA
jgi:hypothetical protein